LVLALLFTETEFGCEVPFVTVTTPGLAKTPTTGAIFAAGSFALASALAALAVATFAETRFAAGSVDVPFVPVEIGFTFALDTTGFAEACTEAAFAVDTAGFTETDFWVDVAGFAAEVALAETVAFAFGAAVVVLAFAPFGEGLPTCALLVAGCTLTVAGAAGFCAAVGVCANAAADRSMSVPMVRII
jgi:hypothetical protein